MAKNEKTEQKFASAKQVAALLKISEYDVKKYVRAGMPKAGANKYSIVECVQWYIDYLQYWRSRRSVEEMATMFGITPRWLNRLVTERGISKEKHGVYSLSATVLAYVQFLREQVRKAEEGESSVADEKRRLLRMQADLRQIELLEKQKALIPLAIAQNVMTDFVAILAKKLDAIPGTALNKLFACKSKEEMLRVLREVVHRVREDAGNFELRIRNKN